jgi:hypothetical protein
MLGFRKKAISEASDVNRQVIVEVQAHNNARKQARQEAKEINLKLAKLFDENGFTLKIYAAAGGGLSNHKGGH